MNNFEDLKTNNVIKNVVTDGTIRITDYNINIGGIDVIIPSTIDGKTVVAIGKNAFMTKRLSNETSMLSKSNIQFMSNKEDNEIAFDSTPGDIRSVVILKTVKRIGSEAFVNNQLTSVIIENADVEIGCWAFDDNENLTAVTIAGEDVSLGRFTCME